MKNICLSIVKSFEKTSVVIGFVFALLAIGIFSINNNRIQLLPELDPPKISFSVNWAGASERFLLAQIVRPYEQALLNKLDDLENIKVTLSQESARFELTFAQGADLDEKEQELRMQLARTRPLPLDIEPLTFRHGGNNVSNRVVGSYFFTSNGDEFTPQQKQLIRQLADEKIASLRGVESVEINPDLSKRLTVALDPLALVQLQLNFDDVRNVVAKALNSPAATLRTKESVISSQYRSPDDLTKLAETPIAFQDDVVIKLADISQIILEQVDLSAVVRFNGEKAIAMRVLRHNGENLIALQQDVEEVLAQNQTRLDALALTHHLSFDTSLFITRAISWVSTSIAFGFALTLLVSLAFFKRIMPTVLAAIITLLSITTTIATLHAFNISINVISLAGLTFSVGMLVDCILIIYEHLQKQQSTETKSINKVRTIIYQIVPALTASTLTSVVVFMPIILNEGVEGQLFKGLSIAYSIALLCSLLLTVLISPWFVKHFIKPIQSGLSENTTLVNLTHTLTNSRLKRWTLIAILLPGNIFLANLIFPHLSFLPDIKRDAIDVMIPLPRDKTVAVIEREILLPISDIMRKGDLPEIKNTYALGWEHFYTAAIRFKDNSNIPHGLEYLKAVVNDSFPNHRTFVMQGNLFGGLEERNNVELSLHINDEKWLVENQKSIESLITKHLKGTSVRFTPNMLIGGNKLDVQPKYERLRNIDVTEDDLKTAFKLLNGSDYIGMWTDNGEIIKTYMTMRDDSYLTDFEQIPFITSSGSQTYLGELLEFQETKIPPPLLRLNGSPGVLVNLRITDKNLTVSEVVQTLQADVLPALNELIAHRGWVTVQGSAASLQKAKTFAIFMAIFALIALVLIVSILLRSLRVGLFVVLTVIPALFGGLLGYQLLNAVTQTSFNVLTIIGFIIMLGIVANNAILLIENIRYQYQLTVNINDAIATGINQRYKAIVISTCTSVFGMLPLIILPSEASQLYRSIAAIIIGGMLTNVLTVFLISSSLVKEFGFPRTSCNPLVDKDEFQLNKGTTV